MEKWTVQTALAEGETVSTASSISLQAAFNGHLSAPHSQGHVRGRSHHRPTWQTGTLKLGAVTTLLKVTWLMTGPGCKTRALMLVFLISASVLITTTVDRLSRGQLDNTYKGSYAAIGKSHPKERVMHADKDFIYGGLYHSAI